MYSFTALPMSFASFFYIGPNHVRDCLATLILLPICFVYWWCVSHVNCSTILFDDRVAVVNVGMDTITICTNNAAHTPTAHEPISPVQTKCQNRLPGQYHLSIALYLSNKAEATTSKYPSIMFFVEDYNLYQCNWYHWTKIFVAEIIQWRFQSNSLEDFYTMGIIICRWIKKRIIIRCKHFKLANAITVIRKHYNVANRNM